jgi:uncharacterized protein (TIGR03083 family)
MDTDGYLEVLADRADAVLDAARHDLDVPIPSCPGWTMADLVAHMGVTWGWAETIVRTGERAPTPVASNLEGKALIDWGQARATATLETLRGSDPDSNCWTFGLPRSRLFWIRRQALESAVHAWDAQRALGEPDALDADLAADGIEEFITVMLARIVKTHPTDWTGQSLHLHRTDGSGEWMLRLGPEGEMEAGHGHGKADAALRGPAPSLYLWCLNRGGTGNLASFGDPEIIRRWAATITL